MEAESPKSDGPPPPSAGVAAPAEPGDGPPEPPLSWPPPGLGGSQGEAWSMLTVAAVGGGLLALPLLWAVAREQPFWSLGPFGRPWWILPATSVGGLVLLGNFFWRLFLLLRAAAKGADRGYGVRMLLQVAADGRGDTGFLFQGARYYSDLSPATRRGLLGLRLWGVYLYLAAALWVPMGCALSLALAARGLFSTGGAWMTTLAPAGILAAAGLACRAAEEVTLRRARRAWFAARSEDRELEREVEEWNREFGRRQPAEALGIGDRGAGRSFRLGRWGVVVLGLLVAVPGLTLAAAGVLGPLVATVALPRFSTVQERLGAVEPLRSLRVPADPEISPVEAGEALQVILHVGRPTPGTELDLPPVRAYERAWIPDPAPEAVPTSDARYFDEELIGRWAAGEIGPEEWAYLRELAAHPAHGELTVLARSPEIDVVSTRWKLPFPDSLTPASLPVPRLTGLREAAYARVARAVVAAEEGRVADADRALQEVISAGLLLAGGSPTLIDNLVGTLVARNAGAGLEDLYRATGRDDAADRLEWVMASAREAALMVSEASGGASLETRLREMPRTVRAAGAASGLRWEYFNLTNTVASCLNLHTAVFGPGESYREWLEGSREVLVRWPGEEALFELGRRGYLGAAPGSGPSRVIRGLFTLTLGHRDEAGSCSVLATGLD